MARSLFTLPRTFVALTALAITALGTGCTSEVVGGEGGGGGSGEATSMTSHARRPWPWPPRRIDRR